MRAGRNHYNISSTKYYCTLSPNHNAPRCSRCSQTKNFLCFREGPVNILATSHNNKKPTANTFGKVDLVYIIGWLSSILLMGKPNKFDLD